MALLCLGLLFSACGRDLDSLKHVRATLQEDGLVVEELGEPDFSGERWPVSVTVASLEGSLDGTALVATSLGSVHSQSTCTTTLPTVCPSADVYTPPRLSFPAALDRDSAPRTITLKTRSKTWVLVTPDFSARPSLKLVAPSGTVLKDGDHVTVDCGEGGTVQEVSFVSADSLTVKLVSSNAAPGPVRFDVSLKRCSEIGVGGTRQQASSRARPEVARFSHL